MSLSDIRTGSDFDWMQTYKPFNNTSAKLELPYFDESFRLFVNVKRDFRSEANQRKLIIMAAPNMTIAQLKKKIETEMSNLYPQDDPYRVGTLKDGVGYNLTNGALVGEVFKHGDTVDVYPDMYEVDMNSHFPSDRQSTSNDLVATLKNVHYSVVSKLTDTYIREYDDKLDLLQTVMSMGLTNEMHLVQNLCVVLNKIFNADLIRILDEHPKTSNLLELVILVMQHWIKEMVERDPFILNNTLMILEMLTKSYGFNSRFKNREVLEKLLTISKQPYISSSTKQQIFRIVHCLNSSTGLHALNHYELTRFDNARGAVNDPLERRIASSLMKGEYKQGLSKWTPASTLLATKSLGNLHLDAYQQRTKNFYTPVIKKELAFTDEERILQRTLNPMKLSQRYSSTGGDPNSFGKSEWDKDDFYSRTVKFSQPPSPKGAMSKFLRSTVEDVIKRQKEEQIKASYTINPYKITYQKEGQNILDKYPPIKLPYSTSLLSDYCQMLHPEINNRDVIIFAMHQLERIIEHAIQDIVSVPERFLACFKLFEFFNFPENARDTQHKILDYLTRYLIQDRAFDVLRNEGLTRLVKSFKFHNPSMRSVIMRFIEKTLDLAFEHIEVAKLITLAICDITSIQEIAMKAIMVKSDVFNKEGYVREKEQMDIEFHLHIPFLVDCAKSIRHSVQFKNYALQTIAHCAMRDYLKGHLMYHGAVEAFIDGLKDLHNVMGNRICAKALVSMTANDSQLKSRVVSAIAPEYKMAMLNEHDDVVNSYLRLLLN